MDHRTLGSNWHPCTDCQSTGYKLDSIGFDIEDMSDHRSIEETDQFRHPGASSTWPEEDDEAGADEDKGDAVDGGGQPGKAKVCVKDKLFCKLPLAIRNDIDDLMKEEAGDSSEESDEAHHHPTVPVQPSRLC